MSKLHDVVCTTYREPWGDMQWPLTSSTVASPNCTRYFEVSCTFETTSRCQVPSMGRGTVGRVYGRRRKVLHQDSQADSSREHSRARQDASVMRNVATTRALARAATCPPPEKETHNLSACRLASGASVLSCLYSHSFAVAIQTTTRCRPHTVLLVLLSVPGRTRPNGRSRVPSTLVFPSLRSSRASSRPIQNSRQSVQGRIIWHFAQSNSDCVFSM